MKPSDIPAAREAVMKHGAEFWPTIYARAIARREQSPAPAGMMPDDGGAFLAKRELTRLNLSELYHVSAAMTDLASAAAGSMPAFTLRRDDLPSDFGLIVFDVPIAMNDVSTGGEGSVHITAACWGLWPDAPQDRAPNGAVWVTWYTDRDSTWAEGIRLGRLSRADVLRASGRTPPLILENESQIPFSDEDLSRTEDNCYVRAANVLRTTWTLMQQENLTAARDIAPPRSEIRRLANRDPDLMKVRVITLRTSASDEGEGSRGNREYHHRWIVRGHWRQQWYASRNVHRPVWIAPHIKGPDDAPILGGEKVYAWMR